MNRNLTQMTNAELKQYISEHRNDDDAFQAAMEVLMGRRKPENLHPYPFDLENPEIEVKEILQEKINQAR